MKAGVVFGYERLSKTKEKIYCISSNTHTIGIGGTRSGKSRCVVLQSIGTLGVAGESMIVTDPKEELYDYTSSFLEKQGYDVFTLDFKNTKKSDRYNFLQPVIDALKSGDIQDAIDKAWNITESLMPENDKGEPIWKNGEASIIVSSIMIVCYENINKYKYQNLANVYDFIVKMSVSRTDEAGRQIVYFEKLRQFLEKQSPDNPGIKLISLSEIAHPKTRSSFYTSALTTLRLFTNLNVNSITSDTNINLKDIARKKTALFIILPDQDKLYYSIASLFVHQLYTSLIRQADKLGGVLKVRVNFILDEFGNFSKIPDLDTKLTVAGSRNIRFNLWLQSFKQLDEIYGKEISSIVRYNCENWLYIQSDDIDTLKELSERLDKYTIGSYSISENSNGGAISSTSSTGSSVQLTGRDLLTPGEIKKIKRPYLLYLSRNDPAVMYCPDISYWNFNKLFSMGDDKDIDESIKHNQRLRFIKNMNRENNIRPIKKISYWEEIVYKLEIDIIENKINTLENQINSLGVQAMIDPRAEKAVQELKMQVEKNKNELRDLKFKLSEKEKEN